MKTPRQTVRAARILAAAAALFALLSVLPVEGAYRTPSGAVLQGWLHPAVRIAWPLCAAALVAFSLRAWRRTGALLPEDAALRGRAALARALRPLAWLPALAALRHCSAWTGTAVAGLALPLGAPAILAWVLERATRPAFEPAAAAQSAAPPRASPALSGAVSAACCAYLPVAHMRFFPVAALLAAAWIAACAATPRAAGETRIRRIAALLLHPAAVALAWAALWRSHAAMFAGVSSFTLGEIFFSRPLAMLAIFADRRGTGPIFPLLWLVALAPAPFLLRPRDGLRAAAALALGLEATTRRGRGSATVFGASDGAGGAFRVDFVEIAPYAPGLEKAAGPFPAGSAVADCLRRNKPAAKPAP